MEYFKGADFSGFWDEEDTDYSSESPSDELILRVEEELGYALPASYIELMKLRNGGAPLRSVYRYPTGTGEFTYVELLGILGIGYDSHYSLLGELGNPYQQKQGFPAWGVYIADTLVFDSIVMLDYRACGKQGEPAVVLVNLEEDCSVTPLANDFETFIRGLMTEDEMDDFEEAEEERVEKEAEQKRIEALGELNYFKGLDLMNFWEDNEYAKSEYQSEPFTDEFVREVEEELGYKLPGSYIELMKCRNGGIPLRCSHPTEPHAWSDTHITIEGILGIGREKPKSLLGSAGSKFRQDEQDFPAWGVCICDALTGVDEVAMLDYRDCGRAGEPEVVFVNKHEDFEITFVAENFESFIRGLITWEEAKALDELEEKKQARRAEKEPEDFWDKLDFWDETEQYGKIVDTIMEIPPKGRSFMEARKLGSALNKLGQYKKALEQLEAIEAEGINDPDWNYLMGDTCYYLDRFEEALSYFERVNSLEPGDEDVLESIEDCKREIDA
ncbi:MAG: SMI1/KNR4 family protein [Tannerellaceae bacterium]|nr:SMI1/KNR4 family protein [Tannerellaceae bacterium]